MIDGINLDGTQPGGLGALGGPAFPADGATLFAALLMDKMNADGAGAMLDADLPAVFNSPSLTGPDIAKLLPQLLGPGKGSKACMPEDPLPEQSATANDVPVVPVWIATILAAQTQAQVPADLPGFTTGEQHALPRIRGGELQLLQQIAPGILEGLKGHNALEKTFHATGAHEKGRKTVDESGFTEDLKRQPGPSDSNAVAPTEPSPAGKASESPAFRVLRVIDVQHDTPLKSAEPNASPSLETAVSTAAPEAESQGQSSEHSAEGHSNHDPRKNSDADEMQPASSQKPGIAAGSPVTEPANFTPVMQAGVHAEARTISAHHSPGTPAQDAISLREAGGVVTTEAAPRIVHATRLMEAAGQAEMHISVKAASSEAVDVRAVLQGEHVSATVAAQHGGTRDWMVANLHELHASLSRDDLNLRTFEVRDSAFQNQGHGSGSQERQEQPRGGYTYPQRDTIVAASGLEDLGLNEDGQQALSLLA